jgi:DNA replication licensing factor MCM7
MALLQYRAPVNYDDHQSKWEPTITIAYMLTILGAFEDFLQSFKTSPKSGLAGALSDMNIDEDDFSDEYDFMDDDDEEGQNARQEARSQAKIPKLKYKDLLQMVADRYEDEITIDLDDLAKVGSLSAKDAVFDSNKIFE